MCDESTAHAVITHLTDAAKGRKRIAEVSPETVGQALDVPAESVRYALEDLVADGVVKKVAEDAWHVAKPHTCPKTDSSIHADTDHGPKQGGGSTSGCAGIVSRNRRLQVVSESSSLTRGNTRLERSVEKWNGLDFANYFEERVRGESLIRRISLGPSPFNNAAFRMNISRWRQQGDVTNGQIKAMIDFFADHLDGHLQRGKPPWKTFLAQRTGLFNDVVEREQVERRKRLSHDELVAEYTTARPRDDSRDEYFLSLNDPR